MNPLCSNENLLISSGSLPNVRKWLQLGGLAVCAPISQRLPRDVPSLGLKAYEPFLWHWLNAKDLWILGQ
jgi:hypothetical protein